MGNGRFETEPVQAATANAPQVSRFRTRGSIPVFLLFLLVPASLPVSAQESFLGDLTGPWQLLVDDYLIEKKRGVVRTWHPLKKHPANPVLGMTGSWGERRTTPYGTVLPGEDGRGYRIWYDIWDGDCHNFYATSRDGLHWIRPRLGLVEHRGSRDNNLFFHRTRLDHMPQIIHTPWEADAARRYKMVNFDSLDAGSGGGAVTTRLLLGLEGELRLNADAGGGEIRVEVLDGEGRVLPGYGRAECRPMTEDRVDFAIRWEARDKLSDSSQPRRLRFLLTRASLFSFKAGDSVQVVDPPAPLEVLYTFDSSQGDGFDDRAAADGIQSGRRHGRLSIVRDSGAGAGGSSTLLFPDAGPGANRLEVPGTAHLGHHFTLAARVKTQGRDRMRLFSTHRGSGSPALGELIFEFGPGSGILRLIVNGQEVSATADVFGAGMYHHLAATYDRGRVRLYLDGRIAASGQVLSGSARLGRDDTVVEMFGPPDAEPLAGVHLADNLHLGADRGGTFVGHGWESAGSNRHQLRGWVDDVLVVKRVLDGEEIRDLSRRGVEKGLKEPEN